MWYRKAYRVVQTPERVWHQSTAKDPFEHPIVNIDPESDVSKIGLGGDAFGKGHYTSQNPYVIFGKRKGGPGELKQHGYVKSIAGHLRRYKIPKGARILDYNAVPGDHAQRIHNYTARLFNRKLYKTFDPQQTYELTECFVGHPKIWAKTLMDLGYDALEYNTFSKYEKPEVERQTVTQMQDGAEVSEPESDEEHEKRVQRVYEDIQKSGKNIVIFNEQMVRNPRFFTKLRTAPETLTEQDIEKEAESAKKHRETYLRLWKQGAITLESLPEQLRPSREQILQMYEAKEVPFANLPLDVQAQEAVMLEAIRDGRGITALDISQANSASAGNPNNTHETLLDNMEIAAYFIKKGGPWKEIPEATRENPSFQAQLIQDSKLTFKHLNHTTAEEAGRVHPEVDRAIRENPIGFYWSGLNIQRLRPDLLQDPEVCLKMVAAKPEDIKYVPREILGDKNFIINAMRAVKSKQDIQNWASYFPENVKKDPEVQALLVATGAMHSSQDPEKYQNFPFWKDMVLNFSPNISVPADFIAPMAMDIDVQRKYLPQWLNEIQSQAGKDARNIQYFWFVRLPDYARLIPQVQKAYENIAAEKVEDWRNHLPWLSPETRLQIQQSTDALNAEQQDDQAAQQDTQQATQTATAAIFLHLIRIASQLDEDGSAQEAQDIDDILEKLTR